MKYFKAGILSVIIHALVICGILFYAVIRGCFVKEQPENKTDGIPTTIGVVPEEKTSAPPAPPRQPAPAPTPQPVPPAPPKQPAPDPTPQPALPAPPRQPAPAPTPQPAPPAPPRQPAPAPTTPPTPPAPPKPTKVPVTIGPRVNRQSVEKQPVPQMPAKTMSADEIQEWLKGKTRIDNPPPSTSQPSRQQQKDFSKDLTLLQNAIYAAWNQPPHETAGDHPAEITFNIGADGKISNPRVHISSGSTIFDNSAIDALNRIGSVHGLSQEFIEKHKESTIEFKLKD